MSHKKKSHVKPPFSSMILQKKNLLPPGLVGGTAEQPGVFQGLSLRESNILPWENNEHGALIDDFTICFT